MTFTKAQTRALEFAFKKGGAWYAPRSGAAGGAYRRCCQRLADQGLLTDRGPYQITRAGLLALRDVYNRKWGDRGCMADLLNLEAVDKALAS